MRIGTNRRRSKSEIESGKIRDGGMGQSLVEEILSKQKNGAAKKPQENKNTNDETDWKRHIDFGSRLMSLAELSRHSGVGAKTLRRMVAAGALRPIRVPYSLASKYSPRQLAAVIVSFNG